MIQRSGARFALDLLRQGDLLVRQMKQKDYHIYLDEQERWQIIQSLIDLKNALIAQGRYTDAVDDVLCKFFKAKQKKIKVQYL